jgi:anion-transporting  ArsA/GET3 family ATPase
MSSLATAVAEADVIVCCGTGGVGKTTAAAALGIEAARLGRRAVVVTIDPAKRLADALGASGQLTNEPALIALDDGPGELWALMLDAASTFDGLVRANAANADQADRILANSFYRNVAGSLSGTQEYMAAERLHALHLDERFDLVIVDTPPTRNALDFLDAPGTLTKFIDHPLFKLLIAPTRRGLKVLNVAAQPVLRTIGKVVGGEVLADAIAFFQAFQGMETGFRQRANEVITLLRSPSTSFVLVASPRVDTVAEAQFFAERLRVNSLAVAAVIVNRATPRFPGAVPAKRPKAQGAARLYDNWRELNDQADAEATIAAPLDQACDGDVTWVPLLDGDVHDVAALRRVQTMLFPVDAR